MNVNEAKSILLLYRPGTADAEDPQIAAALALAQSDPKLAGWLEAQLARQLVIGDKFRQITVPAGLKEQIISEHAAQRVENAQTAPGTWPSSIFHGPRQSLFPARHKLRFALAVMLVLFATLAVFWFSRRAPDDTLGIYQNQMARVALNPYAMDLTTNDPVAIRAFLAQNHAPADFILPAPLQQTAVAGCAVENWQGGKVSLICFRTGKPLPPGTASDLWLFVVDRASVKNVPAGTAPQIAKVNLLITATWTQGDKLYLLGTEGDEPAIKPWL